MNHFLRPFHLIFLLGCLLFTTSLVAQPDYITPQTAHRKAQKAFQQGDLYNRSRQYDRAIEELTAAIKKEPTFLEAYLLRADSYYAIKKFGEAEADFEKIIEINPNFNTRILYVTAIAESEQDKYDEAVLHLQAFLDTKPKSEKLVKQAEERLANFQFAAEAVKNPMPFAPKNLGPNINTPLPEYLPTITADGKTLIFTRRDRYQEDFYVTTWKDGEWQMAENLGPPINTNENEGAETISADGRLMVYTVCNRREDYGSCDLYYSEFKNNEWTTPQNIGQPINSAAWESQPSLSADGQTLYFTSNRSKNKDIFKSNRLPDGRWSAPQPIKINTPASEEGPFIHPDGQTLYFTSNGYPGMGGKDLFLARLQPDGTWGTPQNLGYPINTKADEGALIVSLDGKTAYFASSKAGGFGAIDLYSFEMPAPLRPQPVTYAEVKVLDAVTKEPLVANLEMVDLATQNVHTQAVSDKKGRFLVCLPMGKDYALNINKQGYLFHSENFELKAENSREEPFILEVFLQKVPVAVAEKEKPKPSEPVVLRNVFFESGSDKLQAASKAELEKLYGFLIDNPAVSIQINGHTDNIGSEEDNLLLSENRAKAVVDYLIQKGIVKNRLKFKGFGESKPIAPNETAQGRKKNRRTEFVVE